MRKIFINACIALICAICAFAYCGAKADEDDPCQNCGNTDIALFVYQFYYDGNHTRQCIMCNHPVAVILPCSGGQATCQERANCQYCDAPYGSTDENAHRFALNPVWTWNGTTSATLTLDCSVSGCTESKTFTADMTEQSYYGEPGKDPGIIFTASVDTPHNGRLSNEKDVKQHQWGATGAHIAGSSPSQHTLTCINDDETTTENCNINSRSNIVAFSASCTHPATYYRMCSACGEVSDTVSVQYGDTLEHVYGDWIYSGNETHTGTCQNCPDTQTLPCDYATACPNSRVCSVCSNERYPAGHIYSYFNGDFSDAPNTMTATFVCSRSDCSNTTEGHMIELTQTFEESYRETLPNGDIEIEYKTRYEIGRTFDFTYTYTQHEWGDVTHIDGSSPSAHSMECRNDDETITEECVMQTSYIAPTCFSVGYTVYTCQTCDYSYKVKTGKKLSHWYGEWLPAENGTHSAKCLRGCEYIDAQDCAFVTVVVNAGEPDETSLNVCPVCGGADKGFSLSMVSGARAESAAGKLPRGELIVRRASLGENAALLSVAWEFAGRLEKPEGDIRVLLPAGDFEGATITLINGSEAGSEIPTEYIEIGGEKYISFDADFTASGEAEPIVFCKITTAGN